MPDVEKVINELSKFREELRTCNSTTYVSGAKKLMRMDLIDKTITLLKAQDVMVMAGAELTDAELIEEIRKAPFVLKPNVDAIPVEWLREKMRGYASALKSTETAALVMVMQMWQQEQEAR